MGGKTDSVCCWRDRDGGGCDVGMGWVVWVGRIYVCWSWPLQFEPGIGYQILDCILRDYTYDAWEQSKNGYATVEVMFIMYIRVKIVRPDMLVLVDVWPITKGLLTNCKREPANSPDVDEIEPLWIKRPIRKCKADTVNSLISGLYP